VIAVVSPATVRITQLSFAPLLGFFLGLGFAGCGDGSEDGDCVAGAPFCPCLNGQCQAGLTCTAGYCIGASAEEDTGDEDPGDGDPSGDGDPTGDGDGDPTGDGDGDPTGDGDGDQTGDGDGDQTGDGDGDQTGDGDGDGDQTGDGDGDQTGDGDGDPNEYECANGATIPLEWVCDDYDDCGDNSDEILGCGYPAFVCDDGYHIVAEWECDMYADCADGSDEVNC
jgi:hypothetical protein